MDSPHFPEPDAAGRPAAPGAEGPRSVEARLSQLESQVATLAEAVRALAHGLERIPSQDTPATEDAARGARLAHELLLSQRL